MKSIDLLAFVTVRRNTSVVDGEFNCTGFSKHQREEPQQCRKGDVNHRWRFDKNDLLTVKVQNVESL